MFASKTGAYLFHQHESRLERLAWNKHCGLFRSWIIYYCRKFNNIGPRFQCHKIFDSLMNRSNKLECWCLPIFSSQVYYFRVSLEPSKGKHPTSALVRQVLALLRNIRLNWKDLSWPNTLSYLSSFSVKNSQCSIRLTPGANVIKLFFAKFSNFRYRLECLSLARIVLL